MERRKLSKAESLEKIDNFFKDNKENMTPQEYIALLLGIYGAFKRYAQDEIDMAVLQRCSDELEEAQHETNNL